MRTMMVGGDKEAVVLNALCCSPVSSSADCVSTIIVFNRYSELRCEVSEPHSFYLPDLD